MTLMDQFLDYLSKPRRYNEAMDGWRTSCPRFSIWEDAICDGLIKFERDEKGERWVGLTDKGAEMLRATR